MPTGFSGLSFSGADVRAYAMVPGGGLVFLDSLQTISVSIFREKQPVRGLGYQNVIGHSRGTRTIAGSLIFAVIDRHPLKELYKQYQYDYSIDTGYGRNFFPDQIPPFTLFLVYENEAGKAGLLVLQGVDLTNDGLVSSIEDMLSENTYQYRALDMKSFESVDTPFSKFATPRSVPVGKNWTIEELADDIGIEPSELNSGSSNILISGRDPWSILGNESYVDADPKGIPNKYSESLFPEDNLITRGTQ